MQRRHFLMAGSAGLVTALPGCGGGSEADARMQALSDRSRSTGTSGAVLPAPTATAPKVVVIGGGMAGTSVAKYLRLWGGNIDVTLVDRSSVYTSNIMSSLVLTGQRSITSLQYKYDTLRTKYGVKTEFDEVAAIDPVTPSVRLRSGKVLPADRIVLAPGIEFDDMPGLTDPLAMPHAWQAGTQTSTLAAQLSAMAPGGTVVMTIPKVPYRCPPGPYERACLVADWLKARKPGSKLLVLDANPDFVTERDNFSNAFYGLHGKVIEYHNNVEISSVDQASKTLYTNLGPISGKVVRA